MCVYVCVYACVCVSLCLCVLFGVHVPETIARFLAQTYTGVSARKLPRRERDSFPRPCGMCAASRHHLLKQVSSIAGIMWCHVISCGIMWYHVMPAASKQAKTGNAKATPRQRDRQRDRQRQGTGNEPEGPVIYNRCVSASVPHLHMHTHKYARTHMHTHAHKCTDTHAHRSTHTQARHAHTHAHTVQWVDARGKSASRH